MQPVALLRCLARALARHAGDTLGRDVRPAQLARVAEDVWAGWAAGRTEPELRQDLAAVLRATPADVASAIDVALSEVGSDRPPELRERLAESLHAVLDALRTARRGADDPAGPPLRSAADLASLLSAREPSDTAEEPPLDPEDLAAVILVPIKGALLGAPLVFTDRTLAVVGKGDDCAVRLPDDKEHKFVSRHHCLLDFAPPAVRVRDLGSRNGTFVNGALLGRRPGDLTRTEGRGLDLPQRDLSHGDVLSLASSAVAAFRVEVVVPPRCSVCSAPIPRRQAASCELPRGGSACPACRAAQPDPEGSRTVASRPGTCPYCGRPSPGPCADCLRDVARVAGSLLDHARRGAPGLSAVRDYRIVRELGRGGVGVVYLARHDATGREVALKLLLPERATDEHAIRRFLREMGVLRGLQHPHVVRQIDSGYFHGAFFMAMELCDGGSVAGLIERRGGRLPVDEAVEIAVQALDGLHHAHTAPPGGPVVHRDLKPGNVLLSGSGCARLAKVADFGMAKALDDAGLSSFTTTGTRGGTPLYVPRQQVVRFKEAGPAVDAWALAATLYRMLAGAPPRDFDRGKDPWLVVLEDPPLPIRSRQPSLPARLAEVIDSALEETPGAGFRTALELKEALEGAF